MQSKNRKATLQTKRNFYEDVIFKNENNQILKKQVKDFFKWWTRCLKENKQIKLESFKDLLQPLEEIVLPVTIFYHFIGRHWEVVTELIDAEGKEYRIIWGTKPLETYIIENVIERKEHLERDYRELVFQINKNETILIGTNVRRVKIDGTSEVEVKFEYDTQNNKTKVRVVSDSYQRIISMQYPTQDSEFDKKVLDYLFYIEKEKKSYYFDVFPILQWLTMSMIEITNISIIAEIRTGIISQIQIENGIVERYTQLKVVNKREHPSFLLSDLLCYYELPPLPVINKKEIHIQTITLPKEVKEFIKERCQ